MGPEKDFRRQRLLRETRRRRKLVLMSETAAVGWVSRQGRAGCWAMAFADAEMCSIYLSLPANV